ncbi:MAG: YCF48-related protein [Bacteroidota bacterium]|nr:YCF48-related protein [Bacteroidota bacterium]
MRYINILLFFILLFNDSFSQWTNSNSGTTQNLRTIFTIDAMIGYAGGENGLMLKTTNNGSNWNTLNTGTSNNINSIYFYNSTTGLVCCNSGQILLTTNAGNNWNNFSSGVTDDLLAMSFYNNINGVCSGSLGTLMFTTNGGLNWTVSKNGFLSVFYGVNMITASDAYACGVNTIFQPLVAKTTNGGANWEYSVFYLNGNEGNLKDINFISTNEGFTVSNVFDGQGGVSYTSDGGANWTTQLFPNALNSIDLIGTNTGYTVGYNGLILKTSDGGITWNVQQSGVSNTLRSVDFADAANGFAVGDDGIILKTTNGGLTVINTLNQISPESFSLSQNYPNPFNPNTNLEFGISNLGFVSLKVYNVLGVEVSILVNEMKSPGSYEVEFNGSNFPSGIYFYRIQTEGFIETKSMMFLK